MVMRVALTIEVVILAVVMQATLEMGLFVQVIARDLFVRKEIFEPALMFQSFMQCSKIEGHGHPRRNIKF